ncbi:MAG: RND family transporter, partial [Spirochaetaceae bacterium]
MNLILNRPRLVIAVTALITLFFALQLPRAQLDNDVMSFVPATHPEKMAMDEIHDTYDATIPMSVGIEFSYGTIFSAEAVELVRALTEALESLEDVRSVTSLTNADYIEGVDGGMRVTSLVADDFSGTTGEIEELKRRVLSWELYDNSLYSRDFRATQILVGLPYRIDADTREAAYYRIRDILRQHEQPGVNFYFAGDPVIAVLLSASMRSDLLVLIPLVVVVVLTALFLFFRRTGGVLLPIITVLVSSVWTIGAMALLGIALTMVATVIPVLMVAVGSAYGIHIVNHYYRTLDGENAPVDADRHKQIIEETLRTVGKPVLMAGLTTIIGFGALTTSQVGPMRSFGVFTAFGVATALLVALTLIPSLLLARGPGATRRRPASAESGEFSDSPGTARDTTGVFLLGLYTILSRGRWRVLFLALVAGSLAVWGTSRVVVDNELIMYFKGDTEIRRADEFLRRAFGGTRTFNIEVIGEEAAALTNPEILQAMDDLARYLVASWPEEVPKVLGYQNFIMRMNQVMHVDEPPPGSRVSRASPHPLREPIPFWRLGRDLADEGSRDG